MQDEKYVVVKREAFDQLLIFFADKLSPAVGEALNTFASAVLEDAVVIRTQDIFATSGLWAYAHTMQTYIELTHSQRMMTSEELKNLAEARDYFSDRANEAERMLASGRAKVPD